MGVDWAKCTGGTGVATINCIPYLVATLIYWLLVLAGSVSLILIIVSGIRYLTSGGDAKKMDQARKTLIYAILGLILIFTSFLIVETVAKVTGVGCINNLFALGFSACK